MKKWVLNFLKDERGAETVEFGIGALVIGGGAAAGLTSLKGNLQDKTDQLIERLGDVSAD